MFTSLPLALLFALGAEPGMIAQPAPRDSGFQLRVFGDIVVGREAREGAVVVIKGNAHIEGTVRAVVVLDGTATITGGTVEDLTVMHGHAQLNAGALVTGHAHLIDADITMAEGARVTGTIERGAGRRMARDVAGLAALVGFGILLALVLGGVIAAEVAPHGIRRLGDMVRTETGRVGIGALFVWLLLPLAAGMLVPTVIGLPLGLGYFLFILPVFWYLGLIVAGTWVGDQLLGRMRHRVEATRPWQAAIVGITALLLLGRLPVIGFVAFVMVAMGGGALALLVWRTMRPMPRLGQLEPMPAVQAHGR